MSPGASILVGLVAIAFAVWSWREYDKPPGVGGMRGPFRWWHFRFAAVFLMFAGVGGLVAGLWRAIT